MVEMSWGMMWYEEGELEDKVANAALRYEEKFLEKPNTCFVPADEVQDPIMVAGCKVMPDDEIIENHLWMGIV